MDPLAETESDQASEAPQDSPAEPRPEAPPSLSSRSESERKDEKASDASKLEKRREHLERALKASGKAPEPKGDADPDADADPEEADTKDPDEKDEDKDAKPDPLDKIKNGKHVRIATKKLKEERAAFAAEKATFAQEQAREAQINAAATREYGPIAEAAAAYARKDYRSTATALKRLFKDDFPQIARNIWNATKDGMPVEDLRMKVRELEEKLQGTTQKIETEKVETTKADENKQLRASFDKRTKGHELARIDDDGELRGAAFKAYQDSWDPDLEEHTLTPKQAADQVLEKQRTRAAKLTGKRIVARETPRETRAPREVKSSKDMTPAEKRQYHLDRALRTSQATARERQRNL